MRLSRKQRTTLRTRLSWKSITAGIGLLSIFAFIIQFELASQQEVKAATAQGAGKCLTFNGTSSYVDLGSTDFGLSASNTMSICAWVKWSSTTGANSWANIATCDDAVSNGDVGQFWLQHDQTNSHFEFALSTSSRKYVQGNTALVVGNWYFVCGTYDGANLKLYVNGVLQGSTTQTGNVGNFSSNYKFMIGKWAYNGRYFNGDIDEVSLWNCALTQTQIREMLCKKLSGTETGLKGLWKMDETSGTTVYDATSYGHNGTNHSATISTSTAPVGSATIYTFGGSSLTLTHASGDSIKVGNFSATPSGIVLYRIDTLPSPSTPPASFSLIGKSRYYGVFVIGTGAETYTTTYYYRGYPGISDESQLALATRTSPYSSWSDMGATLNTTTHTLTKTGNTGNKEIIIGSLSPVNALPVELSAFKGEAVDGQIQLYWITQSEKENDYFLLERSANGEQFETVDRITGHGTTHLPQRYSYTDVNAPTQKLFYRLSQFDYDGKSELLKIIEVDNEQKTVQEGLQSVFPNPFDSDFTLKYYSNSVHPIRIQLIDVSSKPVFTSDFSVHEGENELEMQLPPALPRGIYFLSVTDQENLKGYQRLIKK